MIKHAPQFSVGTEIVNKETYLDNVTSAANSIEETKAKQSKVHEIFKMGGFNLRKWLDKSEALLNCWPLEFLAEEFSNLFIVPDTARVLGASWQPKLCFLFEINAFEDKHKLTKRILLANIASIFDQVG